MTPLEDGRENPPDEVTTERSRGSETGPAPEVVSGVVRVSGLREEAAATVSPVPPDPFGDAASAATELGDVTFPSVWRGYDPHAVDAYVRRVAQTVTALEEMRTPQDVVRRALDRVGEETAAILREAEEAAQRIITKSRSDAADRVQKAEREAHEITQRSRTRLRDLDADIDRIWVERQRLIDDVRKLAGRLLNLADHAEERYPAEDSEAPAGAVKPSLAPVPAPGDAPAPSERPTPGDAPEPSDAPTQTISPVDPKAKTPEEKASTEKGDEGGEPRAQRS